LTNILLLSDDLIFTSRVTGAAAAANLAVRVAKSQEALLVLARQTPPALAILDLANPGLNIDACVAALKAIDPPPAIVAYGPHVDAAGLKAARAAGCDRVLPRSQFAEELPTRLAAWIESPQGD